MSSSKNNKASLSYESIRFLNRLDVKPSGKKTKETIEELDDYILFPRQAIYLFDFNKKKITYSKGIEKLLGYKKKEFNTQLITKDYILPNQLKLVNLIVNTFVTIGLNGNFNKDDQYNIIFMAKHKNGAYIPLLRQVKVIESDKDGGMLSNISLITDFSGMLNDNSVKWKLNSSKKTERLVKVELKKAVKSVFTKQEYKILNELKTGKPSKIIAENLYISKTTVDTHRRNMIKKSGVKNTIELINFALNLEDLS